MKYNADYYVGWAQARGLGHGYQPKTKACMKCGCRYLAMARNDRWCPECKEAKRVAFEKAYKATHQMSEASRVKKSERAKTRYLENRERLLLQSAEYQRTHPEVRLAKRHKYEQKHPGLGSKWAKLHPQEHLLWGRKYQKDHPYEIREYHRRWQLRHPEVGRMSDRKRRALKYGNTPANELLTSTEWLSILAEANGHCHYCGKEAKLTLDHVIPLSKGGKHSASNAMPACKHCNSSKGNKMLEEWTGATA